MFRVLCAFVSLACVGATCCNVPPNDWYTCEELQQLGKCSEDFMHGYCCRSCSACSAECLLFEHEEEFDTTLVPTTGPTTCPDIAIDDILTCEEQAQLGNCEEPWLEDFCCQSCHGCAPDCDFSTSTTTSSASVCEDTSPSQYYTCEEHASGPAGNKCGEPWMQGFCCMSCSQCADACQNYFDTTEPPAQCEDIAPDPFYTCEEQLLLDHCQEPWMPGFCCETCFECSTQCVSGSTTAGIDTSTLVITTAIISTPFVSMCDVRSVQQPTIFVPMQIAALVALVDIVNE